MNKTNEKFTTNKNSHNSGCLIVFIIILFLIIISSLFSKDMSDKEWEQTIHQERMNYIKKCASRAQYGLEDYNHCMSKRPDIR